MPWHGRCRAIAPYYGTDAGANQAMDDDVPTETHLEEKWQGKRERRRGMFVHWLVGKQRV